MISPPLDPPKIRRNIGIVPISDEIFERIVSSEPRYMKCTIMRSCYDTRCVKEIKLQFDSDRAFVRIYYWWQRSELVTRICLTIGKRLRPRKVRRRIRIAKVDTVPLLRLLLTRRKANRLLVSTLSGYSLRSVRTASPSP